MSSVFRTSIALRRAGYRKFGEERERGLKILVYIQRRYTKAGLVPIREARIYPDGSTAITEYN